MPLTSLLLLLLLLLLSLLYNVAAFCQCQCHLSCVRTWSIRRRKRQGSSWMRFAHLTHL